MPGKVLEIAVKKGDPVKKGDVLLILEAMKMQNEIDAPCDGVVQKVNIAVGDNVDMKDVMIRIKSENAEDKLEPQITQD